MRTLLLAAASLAVLSACATPPASTGAAPAAARAADVISANAIEAHIRFLADDLLEGREAGTRGYDIAAAYLESEFRLLGLRPGGLDGYRAAVPLQEMRVDPEGAAFEIEGETLTYGEDFLVAAHPEFDASEVEGELVFVGYGFDMPELGLESYADIDVEGKIVVALYGTPEGLPSDVAAHLNKTATKADMAAAHGAQGLILIAAEGLTRFPFARMTQYAGRPSTTTAAAGADPRIRVSATVGAQTAERLFEGSGHAFSAIVEAAREGATFDSFALNKTVRLAQASTREMIESDNVIAILPGSDPQLAGEVIVVTAHLDHIGICRPLAEAGEDRICNGAVDNASGTAIMLETARAMSQGPAPRRTVAFVALTAEEKGLLGAEHLAANPTPALEGMVANVNLDMPVIRYEFDDLIAFGAEHSSLGPVAEAAAARAGASLSPDPLPQQALFVRSDHYPFVRQGIPAIFLMTGFSSPNPDDDEGQGFTRFLGGDYHGPGDEADAGVLFDQGAKFARINYEIITSIANADESPSWNPDSPFNPE